jgi:hypothetical protein
MSEARKDDGGPAFPVADTDGMQGEYGMKLRDFFAAHAMTALVGTISAADVLEAGIPTLAARAGAMAYAFADAMLAARA